MACRMHSNAVGTGEPASAGVSRDPAFGARVSILRATTGAGHCPEVDMSEEQRDSRAAQPEPVDDTWPYGMPYTVQFPEADGNAEADLEHPAHLPRVGDIVQYIDERGECRRYRVREVLHTLQSSAAQRPRVSDLDASPDALARLDQDEAGEVPGGSGQVRAGLPKVFLEAVES